MNWDQILELHNSENVEIGNHSHSHEYLVEEKPSIIKADIEKSMDIFKKNSSITQSFFHILLVSTVLNLRKLLKTSGLSMLLDNTQALLMIQKIC